MVSDSKEKAIEIAKKDINNRNVYVVEINKEYSDYNDMKIAFDYYTCEKCGKKNENKETTIMINGEKHKFYLCSNCLPKEIEKIKGVKNG